MDDISSGRKWKAFEDAEFRALADNTSVEDLARKFRRTPLAIKQHARVLGIKIQPNLGIMQSDLCNALGIDERSINVWDIPHITSGQQKFYEARNVNAYLKEHPELWEPNDETQPRILRTMGIDVEAIVAARKPLISKRCACSDCGLFWTALTSYVRCPKCGRGCPMRAVGRTFDDRYSTSRKPFLRVVLRDIMIYLYAGLDWAEVVERCEVTGNRLKEWTDSGYCARIARGQYKLTKSGIEALRYSVKNDRFERRGK